MLLEVRSLCLSYGKREVVHNLSFTVDKGECLCVVGGNGSGKSTLLRTLLGLQKATCGEVVLGEGLSHKGIGYLPQAMAAQADFPALAREVIRSGLLGSKGLRPWYTNAERQYADNAAEVMRITNLLNRPFRDLSGGQQRRVLLARAFCATRSLLLLDEPAAGLDAASAEELSLCLERIRKEEGVAILLVTHDPADVLRHADRILTLSTDSTLWDIEEVVRT
ncbi:MAG: ATP-binding cassette domain-containing protein [Oscillospiraceae bacterium]|jgi:zinc transport system ATP-binding protein|nr:ATP-binding cassette domain-containing protein [Oscillospiraceae bacterium]